MIGLLGAKIWVENQVDFANPINLVPIGAGLILAVGPVAHKVTDDFTLEGIALGTIVLLAGWHLLRVLAPAHMKEDLERGMTPIEHRVGYGEAGIETDAADGERTSRHGTWDASSGRHGAHDLRKDQ
jgi:hypothetical protein